MSAAAHQGWCLKKAKSQSPWDRTHNSLRYFVSRGHALSYFEGDPNRKQAVVRGVIDLRQVKRVRPSVDKSAPELAIDMVVSAGRTYVIVPQPATAEERAKWISVWMVQLQGEGVIAPELRAEAGALLGQGARTTADQPPPALAVASSPGCQHPANSAAAGSSTGAGGSASAWPTPRVLQQGFLHKQPVKHSGQSSMSAKALLSDLSGWKRRYLLLRPGTLQWFRDDPAADGEFLGVLRLGPETRVELETSGQPRLRIVANGDVLLLKDDGSGRVLGAWERALRQALAELSAVGAPGAGPGADVRGGGGGGAAVAEDRDSDDELPMVS